MAEFIINDSYDPAWYPDPDIDVSCAMPDLRYVVYAALGAVVVAAALALWMVRKLRPW